MLPLSYLRRARAYQNLAQQAAACNREDTPMTDPMPEVNPAALEAAARLLAVEDQIARLEAEAADLKHALAADLAPTISRDVTVAGYTISYRAAYERRSYDATAIEAARALLPEDAPARYVLDRARKVSVSYDADKLDTLAGRVPGDTDLAAALFEARKSTPVAATVAIKRN